jgi:hypothetical protein
MKKETEDQEMMVICKRSEQGRWLERNMRETGGGEAETG